MAPQSEVNRLASLETRQQAIEILRRNDRGGYTVPTATGLYPAQWNWDSCLVALGLAEFDEPRAVAELDTLFNGQWPDGMVPHILFHGDDSSYFPNASVWQAGPTGRSSGITQPLVAATVVRRLFERSSDPPIRSRLTALTPKLLAWHRWCYAARDPHGSGLVSIIHPWESGMDNSPIWDEALDAVEPGPSVAHLRKDTGFAAADHRPRGPEYDRYINLVIRFRDNGYRADRLYDISPFRVVDIGFNAILQRANQDLSLLLAAAGDVAGAAEVATTAQKTSAAIERCWHEKDGFFYGVDTHTGKPIRKPGVAGFLPLFARRRSGHTASATGATAGELAGPGLLLRAELRAGAAGVRAAALLARPGVADRQLDVDRRTAAQRSRRPGRAHSPRQLDIGRARGLCRVFQSTDRRVARRLQLFVDGRHVSAPRG